mmetsp:Transcript_21494/g.60010  ORF Transcript_21494/g.60010 Transcript_21494/m.60010 type:complete len:249 (+) Transcript_21494:232-978(+)
MEPAVKLCSIARDVTTVPDGVAARAKGCGVWRRSHVSSKAPAAAARTTPPEEQLAVASKKNSPGAWPPAFLRKYVRWAHFAMRRSHVCTRLEPLSCTTLTKSVFEIHLKSMTLERSRPSRPRLLHTAASKSSMSQPAMATAGSPTSLGAAERAVTRSQSTSINVWLGSSHSMSPRNFQTGTPPKGRFVAAATTQLSPASGVGTKAMLVAGWSSGKGKAVRKLGSCTASTSPSSASSHARSAAVAGPKL